MNAKPRIKSILNTSILDFKTTGISSFDLSKLELKENLDFGLPDNLRLGHVVEYIVGRLITLSANYQVLYENIQIIEDKRTLGEIDFIVQNKNSKELIHLELAYKFYLYDPNLSKEHIKNWIGPNRNDSLQEKLEKLKNKQFPILQHPSTAECLEGLDLKQVNQKLCFLVSLFVPYQFQDSLDPVYENAIKGYYLDTETFLTIDNEHKTYYLPRKKEWGMKASDNVSWKSLDKILDDLQKCMQAKQAPLVWQKEGGIYKAFFIVWW